MRDSGRGETNDELRRLGSTRGKMPKVKTHSVLAVVKGHERGNKVFGERFMNSIRSDCKDAIANNFLGVGVEIAGYTLTCISGKNSGLNPSFWGFRKVISCSEERGQIGHGCMYIIQVEGRFSNLGGRSLDNVVIVWWQSGSGRFAGFRVQNPRLFRGSGGRRRKESKKVSSNCVDLSRKKRLTNFRIEGTEDLWSLEDREMLSAEVWESEGSVGNHPIKRVKSRALKNVGRKHFVEAKLVENGGGTWNFLWGGAGIGKSSGW